MCIEYILSLQAMNFWSNKVSPWLPDKITKAARACCYLAVNWINHSSQHRIDHSHLQTLQGEMLSIQWMPSNVSDRGSIKISFGHGAYLTNGLSYCSSESATTFLSRPHFPYAALSQWLLSGLWMQTHSCRHETLFLVFFFLMFNWRIIALQCCIDFCHRTISISYKYVYLCIYIHIYERVSLSVVSDPMDYNLPGSSVYGISQVRILEWVAIPLSRGFSQPRDGTQVCYIAGRFFTVWTIREAQKEGRQTPGVILMLWLTPPSWASLLPPPSGPLGHHRGQAGSLCYKAASHQLATLHLVVYTC